MPVSACGGFFGRDVCGVALRAAEGSGLESGIYCDSVFDLYLDDIYEAAFGGGCLCGAADLSGCVLWVLSAKKEVLTKVLVKLNSCQIFRDMLK